ncbi:hypothetical protein [Acinetobacter baumannii]|nr:hypothetical protein [Acinetobacter baumannii]WAK64476.1 hypothetical protein OQH41_09395 [Acinetobacter baumannii]
MNNSQHPIMTVTGIRKAAGDFTDDKGKQSDAKHGCNCAARIF